MSAATLKPVLLLCPYFAPQTHAAMFRAHKLAKYLPEYGYRPIVVTTDTNYLYNEDRKLIDELPACVEIYRARHVEPTLRGVRMALGGADRTFSALKAKGIGANVTTPGIVQDGPGRAKSKFSSRSIVSVVGEWPDRYWTWSLTARSLCRELIVRHRIPLIYTTAQPVSPLFAAYALKTEYNMRWIADFRDPIGYGRKHTFPGMLAGRIQKKAMTRAMAGADLVTGLSEAYGRIFFDLYGLPHSRYEFIPTGLDQQYLDPVSETPARREDIFLHVGEVMPNQSERALSILSTAYAQQPDAMQDARLVFVGRREVNEPLVAAMAAKIPGWSMPIEFIDHVPQREVYRLIRRARACLLVPGPNGYWWNNFAKLVDYIALRAPVIADVPSTSEARTELTRAGLGFFLEGGSAEEEARRLAQWLRHEQSNEGTAYARRYTAQVQAQSFARVFDRVLSEVRQ